MKLDKEQLKAIEVINQKIADGKYEMETVACDSCSGTEFKQLVKKDRYGLEYSVQECTECGLIQANPRMTAQSYKQFYKDDYRKLYKTHANIIDHYRHLNRKGKRVFQFINQHYTIRPSTRILEIGCSNGGILFPFKLRCETVTGYDYDKSYVEFGKKLGHDLRVGDVFDVKERYDVVIYSHTLEHVMSPRKELRRVRRLLDGVLFVDVPETELLMENKKMGELWQNAHTYWFTQKTLTEIMTLEGFTMIASEVYAEKNFMTLWR